MTITDTDREHARNLAREHRAAWEKAGRLVIPAREDQRPGNRLRFESESPRSVAELVFLGPRAAVSCQVRPRAAEMSPLNGSSSFHLVKTAAVFGSVHFWAPFMRSMWYL